MDQFKRGCIQVNDLRQVLNHDVDSGMNLTISGFKKIPGRTTFDWKINARQQIGLLLSRMYPTALASFEEVTHHKKFCFYRMFKKWCLDNQALSGFNLTEELMQQLFSDLDPHKKGHLTENDWINAFGSYNWQNYMLEELQSTVASSF